MTNYLHVVTWDEMNLWEKIVALRNALHPPFVWRRFKYNHHCEKTKRNWRYWNGVVFGGLFVGTNTLNCRHECGGNLIVCMN